MAAQGPVGVGREGSGAGLPVGTKRAPKQNKGRLAGNTYRDTTYNSMQSVDFAKQPMAFSVIAWAFYLGATAVATMIFVEEFGSPEHPWSLVTYVVLAWVAVFCGFVAAIISYIMSGYQSRVEVEYRNRSTRMESVDIIPAVKAVSRALQSQTSDITAEGTNDVEEEVEMTNTTNVRMNKNRLIISTIWMVPVYWWLVMEVYLIVAASYLSYLLANRDTKIATDPCGYDKELNKAMLLLAFPLSLLFFRIIRTLFTCAGRLHDIVSHMSSQTVTMA
jgi:hypothetical protein